MSRVPLVLALAALPAVIAAAPPAPGTTPAAGAKGADLRARYSQAQSWQERSEILEALAANDDRETTYFLLPFLGQPEPPPGDARGKWALEWEAVHAHLWRTGRTTALCPAGPPRKVAELAARSADGSIGTAHPLRLVEIARNGAWSLLCQARRDSDGDGRIHADWHYLGFTMGDRMQPYLVAESGPGWQIDRLLASDPAGRYVAVRQGVCLQLVDVRDATAVALPGADLRDVAESPFYPRVAFAPDGTSLAYVRGGPAPRIVVRELASARETVLDPAVGFVRNLVFDRDGRSLLLEGVPGAAARQRLTEPATDCWGGGGCIVQSYEGPLLRRRVPLVGPAQDVADFSHEDPVAQALGPATVSRERNDLRGIWATRADGAQLRAPGDRPERPDEGPVPSGPLRWQKKR